MLSCSGSEGVKLLDLDIFFKCMDFNILSLMSLATKDKHIFLIELLVCGWVGLGGNGDCLYGLVKIRAFPYFKRLIRNMLLRLLKVRN